MRTTSEIIELPLSELDHVVGGSTSFGTSGHTGGIAWGTNSNGNVSVTWPGNLGGVNGWWSVSKDGGVQWIGKPQ